MKYLYDELCLDQAAMIIDWQPTHDSSDEGILEHYVQINIARVPRVTGVWSSFYLRNAGLEL